MTASGATSPSRTTSCRSLMCSGTSRPASWRREPGSLEPPEIVARPAAHRAHLSFQLRDPGSFDLRSGRMPLVSHRCAPPFRKIVGRAQRHANQQNLFMAEPGQDYVFTGRKGEKCARRQMGYLVGGGRDRRVELQPVDERLNWADVCPRRDGREEVCRRLAKPQPPLLMQT